MVRTVEKPEIERQPSGTNPPPFFIWLRHRTKYGYDGLGRRIIKGIDSDSPDDPDGIDRWEHFYLSGWQVVEVRAGDGETDPGPDSVDLRDQYIWSPRYIDAPILRDDDSDRDADPNDGDLGKSGSGLVRQR